MNVYIVTVTRQDPFLGCVLCFFNAHETVFSEKTSGASKFYRHVSIIIIIPCCKTINHEFSFSGLFECKHGTIFEFQRENPIFVVET